MIPAGKTPLLCALFLTIIGLAPLPVQAEIEVIGSWMLGKANAAEGASVEGGSVLGKAGPELFVTGNPTYSLDAPEGFAGSLKFEKGDLLYHDEPVTKEIAQFGLEVWVKSETPQAGVTMSVVENGRGSPGFGYGIIQAENNTWAGLLSGVKVIESPDANVDVTSEWTHIALVRDEEDFGTRLYVNGEMVYSSEKREPVPLSPETDKAAFTVAGGVAVTGLKTGNFSGYIAAVRIFKFKVGEFKPEDLLFGQAAKK